MKRWQWIALLAALVAAAAWLYFYRGWRPLGTHATADTPYQSSPGKPAHISWETVNRPEDGFKAEMPAGSKDLNVSAYNESGSTEPVKMLFASPDGDTMFTICWQDNPPVARVNGRAPDRTLEQAKDGMLARTQTTLVNETHMTVAGAPALDITAKNSEGGYLDARLIFINDRLYTLVAVFPSLAARREQDVIRFYNSFNLLNPGHPPAKTSS